MLTLFVRAVLLFISAVIAMRLMGKREIGQLQPYELVVVIMIAELAATPIGDVGSPLLYGILPMAALVICRGIISWLCMVSDKFRTLMCGQPTVLIKDGVICEDALREMSVTLTDLMEDLRLGGVMDPSQVGMAVLETDGQVTVFPKAAYRPLTPVDMNIQPEKEGLPLTLIMDGKVQEQNLQRGSLTQAWLTQQLQALGYAHPQEVFFMCVNTQGLLLAQGRQRKEMQQRQVFAADKVRW
ncbi:MAG: DUF421 domain-containing protein [Clostridia bacterium]|nr:DUF421 domain-containing protein [Clostridia bacterium]